MSEYTNVERPFLDKLHQLGWEVINPNEASAYCSELSDAEYSMAAPGLPINRLTMLCVK